MAAPPPSFQDTMHAAATINQAANAAGYMMPPQQNYDAPPPQQSGSKSIIKFDPSYVRTFPGMLKVAECVSTQFYFNLVVVAAQERSKKM